MIFLGRVLLLLVFGGIRGVIRQPGNDLVFGVQPGTEVYQLTSLRAKREEFYFFGFFSMMRFDSFIADWTFVFHTVFHFVRPGFGGPVEANIISNGGLPTCERPEPLR